jgi:hypothetical protein
MGYTKPSKLSPWQFILVRPGTRRPPSESHLAPIPREFFSYATHAGSPAARHSPSGPTKLIVGAADAHLCLRSWEG